MVLYGIKESAKCLANIKAQATLETGCLHTVLSQEHREGETPQGKTVLS